MHAGVDGGGSPAVVVMVVAMYSSVGYSLSWAHYTSPELALPPPWQALLDEGSLDARTYAKRVLWDIRRLVGSEDAFNRVTRRLTEAKVRGGGGSEAT